MKKIYITILLSIFLIAGLSAQNVLLETSFEGPGFDEGWTIGVSQGNKLPPEDYPAGLDPWEKWSLTESTSFGYVHSGDSAAWIGGTAYLEPIHDWLMTPLITIPEDAETTLYYWLWYHSEASYVNKFYIMIYHTNNGTWQEAYLLANEFNSPYHYTEEYSLDLTPWKGEEVMIAFVKNGTYQMAMDDVRIVYTETDSVDEVTSTSKINIYPNPAKDVVRIEIENYDNADVVTISDVSGRTLISESVTSNEMSVDVSMLSKGLYLIKAGDIVEKILVE